MNAIASEGFKPQSIQDGVDECVTNIAIEAQLCGVDFETMFHWVCGITRVKRESV